MFTHCKQNVWLRPRNHNPVQLHGKFLGHKIWHASQRPCLCTDPPGICPNFRSHLKERKKKRCYFLFLPDIVVIRFVIKRGFLIMPLKPCLPFHWCLLSFIGFATCEAEIPHELLARDFDYDYAYVSFQRCSSCDPHSSSETACRAVPQVAIKSPHKVHYFFLHHNNSVGCHQPQNMLGRTRSMQVFLH